MRAFDQHTGLVMPLNRANIDTDAIIPKQYLKSIERTGFGVTLFDDWRYLDQGSPESDHSQRQINPDFVINQHNYINASILLAQENFGCGSSREHAVWALTDYGFRVVIAPSFADIFFNNSFKSGLLPIVVEQTSIDQLFTLCADDPDYQLSVDLVNQRIEGAGFEYDFDVDAFRKHCLVNGLDDIGLTLQYADEIKAFETQRQQQMPWFYTVE